MKPIIFPKMTSNKPKITGVSGKSTVYPGGGSLTAAGVCALLVPLVLCMPSFTLAESLTETVPAVKKPAKRLSKKTKTLQRTPSQRKTPAETVREYTGETDDAGVTVRFFVKEAGQTVKTCLPHKKGISIAGIADGDMTCLTGTPETIRARVSGIPVLLKAKPVPVSADTTAARHTSLNQPGSSGSGQHQARIKLLDDMEKTLDDMDRQLKSMAQSRQQDGRSETQDDLKTENPSITLEKPASAGPFTVKRGEALKAVMTRWSEQAGYQLVFEGGFYVFDMDMSIAAPFERAIEEIFIGLKKTGTPVYANLFKANRVLVVSSEKRP